MKTVIVTHYGEDGWVSECTPFDTEALAKQEIARRMRENPRARYHTRPWTAEDQREADIAFAEYQLDELDLRLGKGKGAQRERARLAKIINQPNP